MSEAAPEAGDVDAEQMLAEAVAEPEQAEAQEQPQPNGQAKPDTGTAKTVDWESEATKWKSLARKHENTARQNADAARKYTEYEESQKTEQQRLIDRLEAAERERDEERRGRARLMAAATHNLSAGLLDRLGGSTDEEIGEAAQELATEIDAEVTRRLPALVEAELARRLADLPQPDPAQPTSRRPVEALTPGAMSAGERPRDGNDWFRGFVSGGT